MTFQMKGRLQLKDISEAEATDCSIRGVVKSDTFLSDSGGLLENEENTGGSRE